MGINMPRWGKKELLHYVKDINKNKSVENDIISQPGGDVNNIMNMIVSMSTMICLIMQTEIDNTLIKQYDISI